jgi:choloylglycine hydrolase
MGLCQPYFIKNFILLKRKYELTADCKSIISAEVIFMCTAISFWGDYPLFGRTLDVEGSYGEEIIIYRDRAGESDDGSGKYIIGVGVVREGDPLFFDAVNSSGLAGAGLNLPFFTRYAEPSSQARNIPSHSVIFEVLSSCVSVAEVEDYFADSVITDEMHSSGIAATPLHWIFSDRSRSVVIESIGGDVNIYRNEWGVLTNAPSFDFHNLNIRAYSPLRTDSVAPSDAFIPGSLFSRGLGSLGLPGDFSSPSRFIRAGFLSGVTTPEPTRCGEISRIIHILDNVAVPRGSVITETGKPLETVYTVCYDLTEQICYLKTYGGCTLLAVSLSDYLGTNGITRIAIEHELAPKFITP